MSDTREHVFEATIEAGRRGGAFVKVPFDVKRAFGSGRPKVRVRFDGHPYRGSISDMGEGPAIGVRKDVRATIGKDVGDAVRVEVTLDTEPRTVRVPEELARALEAAPGAATLYEGLSYTHRREFAEWVGGAKKPETRDRRAARAVEMIRAGETR